MHIFSVFLWNAILLKYSFIPGIVVEDCLLLLQNLLRNNASNQNFFKEGSYIQKLRPFFHLEEDSHAKQAGWSAQKVTNMHLLLQVNFVTFTLA